MGSPLTTLTPVRSLPCNFSGNSGSCNDAGYLWDLSDPSASILTACPACNTLAYLESAKATAETQPVGWYDGEMHTGVEVWLHAITLAHQWNPVATREALYKIGYVNAIEAAICGFRVHSFAYNVAL